MTELELNRNLLGIIILLPDPRLPALGAAVLVLIPEG